MIDRAGIFAEWFGTGPAAGPVAAVERGGQAVAHTALMAAGHQTVNGLHLTIKRLREAMDRGSIENIFAEGYRLTDVGLADCDLALADAAQRRVA